MQSTITTTDGANAPAEWFGVGKLVAPWVRVHVFSCDAEGANQLQTLCRQSMLRLSALVRATVILLRESQSADFVDGEPIGAPPNGARSVKRVRLWLPAEVTRNEARQALRLLLGVANRRGLALMPVAAIERQMAELSALREELRRRPEELERVREAGLSLAFQPLEGGPRTAAQAARIMGFANEWGLEAAGVNRRFRQLAMLFHPDTGPLADPIRMTQLSAARDILIRHLKAK